MAVYTMSDIVSLTGIKAHTLRKWESRYDFIIPHRTDTNIRYYSDNQLRKLLNVGILIRNGYRVSQIDKMPEEEIRKNVSTILLEGTVTDEISALTLGMIKMDEPDFEGILDRNIIENGLLRTVTEIIYPFLNHVGILWSIHSTMPAQEHFISNIIRRKLFAAIDALPTANPAAPRVILFLPEGETHEIGLLMAYFIARKLGWNAYYLGQDVPLANIGKVVEITDPQLLMTLFITQRPDKTKAIVEQLNKTISVPLAVSGTPENLEILRSIKKLIRLEEPAALIDLLEGQGQNLID